VSSAGRGRGVTTLFATAVLLVVLALPHPVSAACPAVRAASPGGSISPSPSAGTVVIDTGDPRSNGQGPGLVGSPFAIAIGVILLGLIAAGGTLLYLRVADRR
jgi:hypothetical protein